MPFFSFVPPIKVKGTAHENILLRSPGKSKRVHGRLTVDENGVSVTREGEKHIVIKFDPLSHVHFMETQSLPPEIRPLANAESLEALTKVTKSQIVIYHENPPEGFIRLFLGGYFPFAVRRSNHTLCSTISELRPFHEDLFIALEAYGEPYEEHVQNAIATFSRNLLGPIEKTLQGIVNEGETEVRLEKGLVEAMSQLLNFIGSTGDLISILNYNVRNTEERSIAANRIILPILKKLNLQAALQQNVILGTVDGHLLIKDIKVREVDARPITQILFANIMSS